MQPPGSTPASAAIPLRLLLLEDDPDDAELLVATLTAAGYACDWQRVDTREAFQAQIETSAFDLVLADYSVPTFDGLAALRLAREHDREVPFIFVSGALGEDRAIESLKAGATDYVSKTRLSRLAPVVERALRECDDQRHRRDAEAALETEAEINAASAADLLLAAQHLILDPGGRNDEQRGEKEPEQGVQPDQRQIEAAEAEAHPDRAQRTVCFQEALQNSVS